MESGFFSCSYTIMTSFSQLLIARTLLNLMGNRVRPKGVTMMSLEYQLHGEKGWNRHWNLRCMIL